MAKYAKSSSSGSPVHIGERMGSGPVAGSKHMSGMHPGRALRGAEAKNFTEGGGAGGKGMKTQSRRDQNDN